MQPFRQAIIASALIITSQPLLAEGPQIIAEINGAPITQQQLDNYAQARQSQGVALPKEMLLGELVNRELITQDATSKKLHEESLYIATLKEQQNNLLAAYALQKIIQSNEITEEQLRAEYQRNLDRLSETEYLASHILLEEKTQAEAVIADLQNGANFAELAKEKSIGPSGEDGGSLDWFHADRMVEEFSQAVKNMKKGEITQQPVQTQFGWHVIHLQDTRKLPAPSFESIKEQLHTQMINARVANYIKGLREKANILLKDS